MVKTDDDIDWSRYKTIPITLFPKVKAGTCWDFVNFEHNFFKVNDIPHNCYLFVSEADDGSTVTHTFIIFQYGKNEYWFESAWKKYQGIHTINGLHTIIQRLQKTYGKHTYDILLYNPDGLDAFLTGKEFMDQIYKTGKFVKRMANLK